MSTTDLRLFIEERLREFDPTIDLSEGSPAQMYIVEPLLERFRTDPFEMDIEAYITELLQQTYPDVNFNEGSGIRDLLVKPAALLLDPISREVQIIKRSQSLAYPDLLSSAEADALVANLFISRATGSVASGKVRLYFAAPVPVSIGIINIAYTASGLRFIPTSAQSISAEAMLFNQDGGLYYFDVNYIAEAPGSAYNIKAGEIVGIEHINNAVRVTNLEPFEFGVDEETTEELISRAEMSVTERSLVTARGVYARLKETFPELKYVQVVGFSDPEMQRDIITGGDLGDILLAGNDGYTDPASDGGATTQYLSTRYSDFGSLFANRGPVYGYYLTSSSRFKGKDGEIRPAHPDHIIIGSISFTPEDVGRTITLMGAASANNGQFRIAAIVSEHEVALDNGSVPFAGVPESSITWVFDRPNPDMKVVEVINSKQLKVDGHLPSNVEQIIWAIRKKELTLSSIPGGIVTENSTELSIPPDTIHIGGCTDFYVRGAGVEQARLEIDSISSESHILTGVGLSVDTATYPSFVRQLGIDFRSSGVKPGQMLIIESGANAGIYSIIRVGEEPGSTGSDGTYLQVYPRLQTTESGMRYRIVDKILVDLIEPKTVRGEGSDAQTLQLSKIVTTSSAVDFGALGVEAGDILELLGGQNKGVYVIEGVSGLGNRYLILTSELSASESGVKWRVYKRHAGISKPLVRIESIDVLDSSGQLTGDKIPYAGVVDIRSFSFSNAGEGVKVEVNDAVTGIVGQVDLNSLSYPLGNCSLQISVNGGAGITIDLSGAGSISEIIQRINSAVPNIADVLVQDAQAHLVLRSLDRWLKVISGSNILGLADGEDNRQIKSASVSDWLSEEYRLLTREDAVYIKSGENIGLLHLVAVEQNRILAVMIDEQSGTLRFLRPDTNVQLAVGSRSYGKARLYFLEPTSFEVRGAWRPALKNTTDFPANRAIFSDGLGDIVQDEEQITYFTAEVNGAKLRFIPDPELGYQVIPYAGAAVPNNLTTNGNICISESSPAGNLGKNSRSGSINFFTKEIKAGDIVEITYQPIQSLNPIDVDQLKGKTISLSLGNTVSKTLMFPNTISSEQDVVDEINRFFGSTIAYKETINSVVYLRLEADLDILVVGGTALSVLGITPGVNNSSPNRANGPYTISYVGDVNQKELADRFTVNTMLQAAQAQHFKIHRPGVQRIHATAMKAQMEMGLYYMDVELVSEGPGDQWNIDAGLRLSAENYISDGYRLVTSDSNLTFSMYEKTKLELSRKILPAGASDDPAVALSLWGQNIQINYDRAPIVLEVQNFASSDLDRVVTANVIVRHLLPHYVRMTIYYLGGSDSDVVRDDLIAHINSLGPDDRIEVSDIQNIIYRRGASYVRNPIDIIAVVHLPDRSVVVERSNDYVTRGRLATFFPEDILVYRETPRAL